MEAEWPEAWNQREGLGRIWEEKLTKLHTDGVQGVGARKDLGLGQQGGHDTFNMIGGEWLGKIGCKL